MNEMIKNFFEIMRRFFADLVNIIIGSDPMILTSSYSIEFKDNLRAVKNTVRLFREAVEYLIAPVKDHYEELEKIKGSNYRQQFIERLVHSTKNHKALYDFDEKFYKFPCYFRRSAIRHAIGAVSSYMSNHKSWEENR